jgi:hypothetical protein
MISINIAILTKLMPCYIGLNQRTVFYMFSTVSSATSALILIPFHSVALHTSGTRNLLLRPWQKCIFIINIMIIHLSMFVSYKTDIVIIISSNIASSRHDIAVKLLIWRYKGITASNSVHTMPFSIYQISRWW